MKDTGASRPFIFGSSISLFFSPKFTKKNPETLSLLQQQAEHTRTMVMVSSLSSLALALCSSKTLARLTFPTTGPMVKMKLPLTRPAS